MSKIVTWKEWRTVREEAKKRVERGWKYKGKRQSPRVTICDEREEKSPLLEALPGTFSNLVYSPFPVVKHTFAHSN